MGVVLQLRGKARCYLLTVEKSFLTKFYRMSLDGFFGTIVVVLEDINALIFTLFLSKIIPFIL